MARMALEEEEEVEEESAGVVGQTQASLEVDRRIIITTTTITTRTRMKLWMWKVTGMMLPRPVVRQIIITTTITTRLRLITTIIIRTCHQPIPPAAVQCP